MELTSSRPPQGAPAAPPTVTTAVHATRSQMGGQCSGCGARLAGDQRYCTECGRRTGEARPTLMREPGRQGVRDLGAADASAPAALRTRNAPQGTLIAGIGVLLLAMGVGVLIGKSGGDGSTTAAATPQIIQAAPAAAVVASTTPAAVDASTTTDAAASTADTKAAKKAAKAAAAAAKAPAVVKKTAGTKVKVGDKGTGPGYDKKTGEFDGNFFGP